MLYDAILICIGIFLGWFILPQPQWATNAWKWLRSKLPW